MQYMYVELFIIVNIAPIKHTNSVVCTQYYDPELNTVKILTIPCIDHWGELPVCSPLLTFQLSVNKIICHALVTVHSEQ